MENIKPNKKFDWNQINLSLSDKPFDVLRQFLGVARELDNELSSKLSYFELSYGKLKVLKSLLIHECPLSPSELADIARVTRSTITGLLDGLEKDEFIRRSTLEDRRKTGVYITEKGREVIETLFPLYFNHVTNIFSKTTKEEQLLLLNLLEKIKDGLHYAKDHNIFPT